MSVSGPGEAQVVQAQDGLTGAGITAEPGQHGPNDVPGRSLGAAAWRKLRRDKAALAGGVVVILFVLVAILAEVIQAIYGGITPKIDGQPQTYVTLNNDPNNDVLDPNTQLPLGDWGGVSPAHWLGVTPSLGRDIFLMLVYGARTSLIIGVGATALALVLVIVAGVLAGFFRGWIDVVLSRIMDVLLSFPTLLFSLSVIAVVNLITTAAAARYAIIIFVLGFFGFPYLGRIVRGQVLSLREKEFVDAARSLGASNLRIMAREIAPNLVGPVLVYTTLTIPTNILGEAGLSFLGVGIVPPASSWGQMIADSQQYFQYDPAYLVFPGLAIFISVLAFNLLGDGLRDALDPRSTR